METKVALILHVTSPVDLRKKKKGKRVKYLVL
jgi:hypothetical protein